MTELEALTDALITIRQIGRGQVTAETRVWAYEQVEFLMKRIKDVESMHWAELNYAAKTNLSPDKLKAFHKFKDQLREDGHKWEHDAYDILSGFIWDATEGGE